MAILGKGTSERDDMPREPDRRHFLGTAAMTLAAVRFGLVGRLRAEGASASLAEAVAEAGTSEANRREARQIAALGRATEWLNSPALSGATLRGKIVLVQLPAA